MEEQRERERFMAEAIQEALKSSVEATQPNPRVGSVIVEAGEIVARGRFKQDGGPHAERDALAVLGRAPNPGATMYVTLEPCSTHGRTGACTEAIVNSGLTRVVVGAIDPTPTHRGNGLEALKQAGIEVVQGVLEPQCEAINSSYEGRETG